MKQIILGGGFGKRVSHLLSQPKQFSKIIFYKGLYFSTYMLAIDRAYNLFSEEIIITVSSLYLHLAIKQLELVIGNNTKRFFILVENCLLNTLNAVYNVLYFIQFKFDYKEEKLLISPSDHIIRDYSSYEKDILRGVQKSKNFHLFGVYPKIFSHSVNYGNIFHSVESSKVDIFLEKPSIDDLTTIDKSLIHSWNSGIFLINKNFTIQKTEELIEIRETSFGTREKNIDNFNFPIEKIFFFNIIDSVDLLKIPFDFLIAKNLEETSTTQANFDWIDIGSEDILKEVLRENHLRVCSSVG